MRRVDLRSDTLTKPSEAMRKAMLQAPVGDDVYLEDPTILALEEKAADLLGMESALFVSSGTMGNLIAAYLHAPRGTEVLMHERAHTYRTELSGISAVAGAKPLLASGDRGILKREALEPLMNKRAIYYMERTSAIFIENTHNFCGGSVWNALELVEIADFAREHKLALHMDGARLFNASVASGMSAKEIVKDCHSVTFCLSKGLGAPVGSILAGDRDFVYEARRTRKMLGGGMRQAGMLAAAGIYALDHNIDRLAEDHQHAQFLAKAAKENPIFTQVIEPETNILFLHTDRPAVQIVEKLAQRGIAVLSLDAHTIRFVTHLDVSTVDINYVSEVLRELK
ncbi:aminotransferase class I/II-fold pyridoxal phosphate-dependent enzyme [Spirochaetales bacterium BR151]|uniref:Aminotransferase class I/II-fold pyridoxal phosphate-dependent enzyme n=2 Tax=Entomospira culicis TaxID=2719989 RepID=A0A968GFE7_9SPIO|nr:aminotransferase class I/II-fold pyridoxal phosphate-dependent enzyme [Entomospira culicis]NIZ69013.1 aminotransferase class I/II-fold pyridoxal phosphate-dependent enzyme [Entomospira culicis]